MKQNKISTIKYFVVIMLVCVMTCIPCANVFAADDDTQKGSISAVLEANGGIDPLVDAEITIYRVAEYYETNGKVSFAYTDEYMDCDVDMKSDNAAYQVWQYTLDNHLSGKTKNTDTKGYVKFENLDLGLYLVAQTKDVDGFLRINPFFVSVPEIEGDESFYDVNATPKVEVEVLTDIAVQKVWNDDGKHRPPSIKVALKRAGETYDTVTLSEENNWRYVWKDLKKSDEWYVEEIDVPKGYTVSYSNDGWVFVVENTPGLIQTGQLKWPIPFLAMVGVIFIIAGCFVRNKNEQIKENNE